MKRHYFLAVLPVFCALAIGALPALAQPPAGGGPSPAERQKIWAAEATSVAQIMGLPADQTKKMVDAYTAARDSHGTAMRAQREKGGRGEGTRAAMMEITKAERAKLEAALKGFLKPEQAAQALASLGAFQRRWDGIAGALETMGLDAKVKAEVEKLVVQYVVELGAAMEKAAAAGNMESMRETSRQNKEKLDAAVAKLLTPDQAAQWKAKTAFQGGRGPGGGAGREGAGAPSEAKPGEPKPAK